MVSVVCPEAIIFTAGFLDSFFAISAGHRIAQAAPSVMGEQSKILNGSAIKIELITCSTVTFWGNWASGFFDPFSKIIVHGDEIVINQHDIRQLQLGKAAIRTGLQVLLESSNLKDEDLAGIIIAGAFGTYIDTASAISIGMLPDIPLDRIHQVGNAAGVGARMSLISMKKRKESQELAEKISYIELAGAPDFMHTFMQSNYLGKYRIIKGKRKAIG